MNKRFLKNTLILLLLSASVFFAARTILSLKENIVLLENQKQKLLGDLEKEKNDKEQLNIRNAKLKAYIKAATARINKSFVDLNTEKIKLEKIDAQNSILKAENSALLAEKQKLSQEIDEMEMKLSSIDELKKMIRNLKKQARLAGNRGFLLKNGQTTSAPKVKIEVVPAPEKNNNEGNIPTTSTK